MKLPDYLSTNSLSPAKFARLSGLSKTAVTRYLNGERKPDIVSLHKIIQATDGEVGLEDFLNGKTGEQNAR